MSDESPRAGGVPGSLRIATDRAFATQDLFDAWGRDEVRTRDRLDVDAATEKALSQADAERVFKIPAPDPAPTSALAPTRV